MSEINPSELVEQIDMTIEDAEVIPTPIDPTLSHEGEAADAKATGDAIAGVIDNLRVNGKAPSSSAITLYASDIKMNDEEEADTIAEAIQNITDKDASEIMYDSENLITIKGAIDSINADLESELTETEIDSIFDEVFEEEE